MKNVRKLVAAIIVASTVCNILPVNVIAAELNAVAPPEAYGAVPSDSQLKYHEEELAAFIHFGMNTFTNSEWGNGSENPNSFNPTNLNADEWVRTLQEAGFKRLILVAKHHDGFCLWPSKVTDHDVESSTDWQASKGGEGDVLAEVSAACTKYNMDMGIYLSPWDAHEKSYGYGNGTDDTTDTNGDYNEFYMTQLREILDNPKYGNNGKFVEVWMDGAKGSGAAAQNYRFDDWFNLIAELQPDAEVFSPYGTGIRWIGNESGIAGDPVWSKLNKKRITDRYDAGNGDDQRYLNTGDPEGDIWSVGECDVSLTSGWFWHDGNLPKSMEKLTEIYFSSVGRGQPLLLNVAPDNTGNFTSADIERIKEFSSAIKNSFAENLVDPAKATATATATRGDSADFAAANVLDYNNDTYWTMNDGQTTGSLTIDLGEPKTFDIVSIEEYIKLGQRISDFSVEVYSNGVWKNFGEGHTIGAKRLVRGTAVTASQIRINIEGSLAVPLIENVEVFKADEAFEMESIVPQETTFIDNVDFSNKNAWIQESIGINGTGMYTSTQNAYSSFTFTGTKAWVVGTVDPNHGIMEVWIDGEKVADVDTYSSKREISQVIYETDGLTHGEHTVKIVVKGTKNDAARGTAIGIDGAYYLDNNDAGMFEIENTTYSVDEGNSIDVTIKRTAGTAGAATVHFSTSPDSAVHGRHYQDVNTTVEFTEGQEKAIVTIPTIENEEVSGDLTFNCNIDSPTNGTILGMRKKAVVTIIDNDDEVIRDWAYTEEDPFVFPNSLTSTKLLEAELFTLVPIEGNKYVRIADDNNASGGKKISWFESGNQIKVPFYAPKAGTYTLNMTYQSGRTESNPNKVNWSGTNVVKGSYTVPGTGAQDPIPFIETSFDIEITESGVGELIFTADSQASPNIDCFEVVPKELAISSYTITATAGENGTISPEGTVILEEAQSQEFTFTANEGYEVEDVLVDGTSVGALTRYTVENISKDTTISVSFRAIDHDENNPIKLSDSEVIVEAEALELDGEGGEIETKSGASNGKVVGWLGQTTRGNAWLNMWVNSDAKAIYDIEVRYLAGADNVLHYENNDGSVSGSIECTKSYPNFETATFTVTLNEGVDKIKFFNDEASTVNIDSVKITKVEEVKDVEVVKQHLEVAVSIAEEITEEDLSNVVPIVVNEFKEALAEAKVLLSSENATQVQIDASFDRLSKVMQMLSFEQGDKEALNSLVDKIEVLNEAEYIKESWDKLQVILEKSKNVIADENAMEDEVSTTYKELLRSFLELRLKPSKDKLEDLINNVETLDKNKYTAESWNLLESRLVYARSVMANEDADKNEIDNAKKNLEDAMNGLVSRSDNNGPSDNNTSNGNNPNNNNTASNNASHSNINSSTSNNVTASANSGNTSSTTSTTSNNNNRSLPKTGGNSAAKAGILGLIMSASGILLSKKKR